MTTDAGQSPEELLELYLDGLLDDGARVAFEARLAEDPDLREAVGSQRELDGRIHRLFRVPADTNVDRMLEPFLTPSASPRGDAHPEVPSREGLSLPSVRRQLSPAAGRRAGPSLWRLVAALAAAVAMSVWAGLQVYEFTRPAAPRTPTYVVGPKRSMLTVYHEEIQKGFKPEWVCRNDKEFRESFSGRFGQALAFADLPKDVCPQGLSYENILSTFTMHLLVRVDDRAVVVFADKLDRDEPQELPPDSGLHLHRRLIGNLVLYEISPFPEPRVVPFFFDPDAVSK